MLLFLHYQLYIYDRNISNKDSLYVYVPCISYQDYRNDPAWARFRNMAGDTNVFEYFDTICQTYTDYNSHGISIPFNEVRTGDREFTIDTNGCKFRMILHLFVKQSYYSQYNYYVCHDSINYHLNDFSVDTVMNTDTISIIRPHLTYNGCDSSSVLNIIKLRNGVDTVRGNVCNGKNFLGYGFSIIPLDYQGQTTYEDNITQTSSGTIYSTYESGCHTTRHLILSIKPNHSDTTTYVKCKGSNYQWQTTGYVVDSSSYRGNSTYPYVYITHNNVNYDTTGIYYDTTLTTQYGCKNNHTLILKVNPIYRDTIYDTICQGQIYYKHGINYNVIQNVDTTLNHHYQTINYCDSLITVKLHVNPVYRNTIYDTICQGETYNKYGFNFLAQTSLVKADTLQTIKGCDSIQILHLTVNLIYNKTIYDTICQNSIYNNHSFNINATSVVGTFIYKDTLQTTKGCDSIQTLHLTVNPIYNKTIYDTICQGQTYNEHTLNYQAINNTADTSIKIDKHFQTINGCDSNLVIYLHIKPSYKNIINDTICQGKIYNKHSFNIIVNNVGTFTYTDTLQTIKGCDSIQILHLTVNPIYNIIIDTNICQGEIYNDNDFHNITMTGIYNDTLKTTNGCNCDSIRTLNVIVNPKYDVHINDTICQGETYNKYGFTFLAQTSIVKVDTFQTIKGCDSIQTLNIKVNPRYDTTIFAQICNGQRYTLNGFDKNVTGIYTRSLQTINGCDSIVRLNLQVRNQITDTINAGICQGQTYNLNGFNENVAGRYQDTLTSYLGCDSIVVLNLKINPIYNHTIYDTICQNSVYNNHSFNITSTNVVGTNVYVDTLKTQNGCNCDSIQNLHLTVNPIYNHTIYDTICQNERYNNHSFDFIANHSGLNEYTDTLQTIKGCDSVQVLKLYVYPSYTNTINEQICQNEIYNNHSFHIDTLNTAGIHNYIDTLQTINGCDSIQILHLTVNPTYLNVINEQICQGGIYNSHGLVLDTLNTAGLHTFIDTTQTINGCNNIQILNLTVNPIYHNDINDTICQGTIYNKHGFNLTTNIAGTFTYTNTLHTIKGCDSTQTLHLVVNPIYDTTIFAQICNGQRYTLNGFDKNVTGVYTQSLQTINGCDSVVRLNLQVRNQITDTINASICQGQTYNLNGFNENMAGMYQDTLTSYLGCDSIIVLNLIVHENKNTEIKDTICQGQTYSLNGFNQTLAGIYTDTLQTINGCDSIVTLNLIVNPKYDMVLYDSICKGLQYNKHSFNFIAEQTKIYQDTLQTINGCDSTQTLHLYVYPIYDTTINAIICSEGRYTDNGFNENVAGTYTRRLQTINGCDSVVRLNLQVRNQITDTINASICQGQTYNLNGFNENMAGRYQDTLTSYLGCDSIVVLNLIVNPIYDTTINATICQNERYTLNGFDNNLPGVYTHSLQTINGCDSIIHLNLKVNPIYKDTIRATICQGQIYNLHGFNQTTSGIYYDTLQTINGCDSVLILDLLVNPTYNQHIYADICQGQIYNLNGFTESVTGIYYDTLQTINGCDSIKTLHLTVHQNNNDTIFADICENQTYTLNGFNEHLAGNYTKHLQSIYGCDSVVTLSLKVYPTYHTDILAEICQGETYNLNGFNQSASGIYYDTVQSIHGCDSVKKLVLIVYPTYDTTITASICWGQNYTDNGFNVGQTGIYHDTLQSIHGCDSVVNLDLTAIVYNRTIETTICQGGTYNFHGMILNQAGTYTDTLHSVVNGCDSIITLKLKLNLPYNDTIRATICQGEMYDAFGFHETNAGYHPRLLQSQGGCDSLVVLDLTVNPSYKQVINASICPGERYNFHGFTLTQQGTYKDTLQSINGCDSITVLRLNINPKYNDTIKASICQGETYTLNGFNENRTGYYVHSLQTRNGCDSVVTLKLTVNPKKTINIDANICQGDVYNSNDFYVDTTGNYTRVVQDINGCDSTIILHLTVNPSYRDTIEADIKAGETYRGYGFDENNTGYYEHYLQTIHGCDSSMVLHLVVNDPTHVYVPNAFTPADKTNNVFYAYTDEKDIRLSSFKIYDRWGEKVFETDDIKIGWDGRYKGNLCQQGAYIYYIEYYTIDSPNKKLKKKGTLMLLY